MFSNSCQLVLTESGCTFPWPQLRTPILISINIQRSSMSGAVTHTHTHTHTPELVEYLQRWKMWIKSLCRMEQPRVKEQTLYYTQIFILFHIQFDIIDETLAKMFVLVKFGATSYCSRFLTDTERRFSAARLCRLSHCFLNDHPTFSHSSLHPYQPALVPYWPALLTGTLIPGSSLESIAKSFSPAS